VAVDLIGHDHRSQRTEDLSSLDELRELLLPGPIFNPRGGQQTDANAELALSPVYIILRSFGSASLFLPKIHVEDKGLAEFKDLTQLRELRLVQTNVHGPGLAPFVNLRALDLGETPFRDDGISISGMTHLQRLSLRKHAGHG